MWSGTVATIPAGWLLCNGSSGTPDLRDRFIIGARQDDAGTAKTNVTGALTQSGGTKDAITVSHTHTATSTVTDPGHDHAIVVPSGAYNITTAAGVLGTAGANATVYNSLATTLNTVSVAGNLDVASASTLGQGGSHRSELVGQAGHLGAQVAVAQLAPRAALVAEHERGVIVAARQQVLGKIEFRVLEPHRAGHAITVLPHRGTTDSADDAGEIDECRPERLALVD
jgi:hypothetical protein